MKQIVFIVKLCVFNVKENSRNPEKFPIFSYKIPTTELFPK